MSCLYAHFRHAIRLVDIIQPRRMGGGGGRGIGGKGFVSHPRLLIAPCSFHANVYMAGGSPASSLHGVTEWKKGEIEPPRRTILSVERQPAGLVSVGFGWLKLWAGRLVSRWVGGLVGWWADAPPSLEVVSCQPNIIAHPPMHHDFLSHLLSFSAPHQYLPSNPLPSYPHAWVIRYPEEETIGNAARMHQAEGNMPPSAFEGTCRCCPFGENPRQSRRTHV